MDKLPPEIVLQILRTLKDEENNIAPLLRLNSQWFNCGISVLWGGGGMGQGMDSELVEVYESRRQIYASVIRSLNLIVYQRAYRTAFRYLTFPKLMCLTIIFEPPKDEEDQSPESLVLEDKFDLQQYLHSGVRYLWVIGDVNADLLAFPDTYCFHLRTLFITNVHPHHRLKILSGVLQNNGTVINGALTWKDPARRSIRDLKTLHLYLSEKSDTSVLDSTVFPSIFKLTGLHSLELSIVGSTEVISNEDLLSLGSLTQLRELRLLSNDSSSFQAPHFTDSDFEKLVANLPHLVVIKLKLTGSILTAVCLGILGKHCPLLGILYLAGHFDMMVLNPEKVPFLPRLTHLAVGAFIDTESDIRLVQDPIWVSLYVTILSLI
ncbi:unnamed protein product [Aspergillus oryzae]|nr:unnamed protein product [Aspergillus oryzae]GMF93728.1 unnamed protein product [Aspergillus oryzae]